ncbi:MAG TPA: FkbM family methyltransferase [Pirellulaceae bacterium]|nr:FkbM family methyltransferase [Planctomycetales bacterium]MCB9940285.1 FkbM family methyltransferase [Planctomycetaceae bacterium]HRX77684.1 FkbM family methyltransferase [Pirellulaceae bacterium]
MKRNSAAAQPIPFTTLGLKHPLWVRAGTTDEVCLREVFDLRTYEFAPAAMPRVIVDASANVGCTSVFFANRYPDAKIFAIEPETSNFQLLEQNTSPYKNVIPIHAALWSANCDLAVSDPGKGKWGGARDPLINKLARVKQFAG